jgi:hypothetical protein
VRGVGKDEGNGCVLSYSGSRSLASSELTLGKAPTMAMGMPVGGCKGTERASWVMEVGSSCVDPIVIA